MVDLTCHEDWLQGDGLAHRQFHKLPETHIRKIERGISDEAVDVGQDFADIDGHTDNFPDVVAIASCFNILGQLQQLAVNSPDDEIVVVIFGLYLNISEYGVVVEGQEL